MQADSLATSTPAVQIPVMAVAELQDSLLIVMHDLQRLDNLLSHTMDNLMTRFVAVHRELSAGTPMSAETLKDVRGVLHGAVTELQFQDLASQLIVHTTQVLQSCAFRLASEAMGPDEEPVPVDGALPDRPNPVTQSEMDAGSIELF